MKLIKFALLLCSLTCMGQYNFIAYQEHIPCPADFPEGTTRIDIYRIKFNKKGRAKDSTLVRTVLYDRVTNTVSYKKPLLGFKAQDFIEYSDFKYRYDSNGRVVYSEESRREKQKKAEWFWAYRRNTYEYNSFGKVVKHGIDKQESWYMLKGKDTLWDAVYSDRLIYRHEYKDTLLQVDYVELDRNVIYEFEDGVLKDSTVYSTPAYRDYSYYYDNGRLIALDRFARDDKVMTRIRYEYDSLGRLAKEYMDSGFYNNPDKEPEWNLSYTYKYENSEKIVKWHLDENRYDIQSFDSRENLTGYLRFNNGETEFDNHYEYTYKDDKMVKTTEYREGDWLATTEYIYKLGFLKEEKVTTNAYTSTLRYYYK